MISLFFVVVLLTLLSSAPISDAVDPPEASIDSSSTSLSDISPLFLQIRDSADPHSDKQILQSLSITLKQIVKSYPVLKSALSNHFSSMIHRRSTTKALIMEISSLIDSESELDLQLAALLLWTLPSKNWTQVSVELAPALFSRTWSMPLFHPVLRRILALLPDRSFPDSDLVDVFVTDVLAPSLEPDPVAVSATDRLLPGSRPILNQDIVDIVNDLLRCSSSESVKSVLQKSTEYLPPRTWSIVFFDAVVRLLMDADKHASVDNVVGRIPGEFEPYRLHVYAEAVLRASPPSVAALLPCLKERDSMNLKIDLVFSNKRQRKVHLKLIQSFFETYWRPYKGEKVPHDHALHRLLSHLTITDLRLIFDQVLALGPFYGSICENNVGSATARRPDQAMFSESRLVLSKLGFADTDWLRLCGKLHYFMLLQPELHDMYHNRLQTTSQRFVVAFSIAYWHSGVMFSVPFVDNDEGLVTCFEPPRRSSDDFLQNILEDLLCTICTKREAHFSDYPSQAADVIVGLIQGTWAVLDSFKSLLHNFYLSSRHFFARTPARFAALAQALGPDTEHRQAKARHLVECIASVLNDPNVDQGDEMKAVMAPLFADLRPIDQYYLRAAFPSQPLCELPLNNSDFTDQERTRFEGQLDQECFACNFPIREYHRRCESQPNEPVLRRQDLDLMIEMEIPLFIIKDQAKEPISVLHCGNHLAHAYCAARGMYDYGPMKCFQCPQ